MKLFLPALLTCLAVPALADTGASASITGLRYELVDLDPHDGIQPTLDFTGVSSAYAHARRRACVERDGCMRDLGNFQEPVFVNASDSEGRSASASVSGEGLFAAGRFDTMGRVDGDWYGAFANYRSGPGQPTFTVSCRPTRRCASAGTTAWTHGARPTRAWAGRWDPELVASSIHDFPKMRFRHSSRRARRRTAYRIRSMKRATSPCCSSMTKCTKPPWVLASAFSSRDRCSRCPSPPVAH